MRILLLNDYRAGGGAEEVVHQELEGLRARGHDVHLVAAADSIADTPRRSPIAYIDSPRGRRLLKDAIDRHQPDIIHAHNIYHLLSPGVLHVARAWKRAATTATARRVIMTAHDFHLVCPNPGGRRFVRLRGEDVPMPHAPIASELRALAWVIQQRWDTAWPRSTLRLLQHLRHYRAGDVRAAIDTVCCPGPILTSLLERCGLPVVELPNPAPPPQPISPRGTDGPLRLAFLGRLEPEKGIASFANDLHRAATRTATSEHACPPVSLDIFGEGSLAAELEQTRAVARAHEPSRLSITLHGRRPRDEAVDALRRCHALVLPSEWDEVAPLVLDEAVAAGASLLVSGAAPAEYVRRTGIGRVLPSAEQRTAHGLDPLVAILKDMRAAMLAGTLNDFDPAAALAGRSLDDHLDALERVYRGEPLPDRRGATEAAR